MYPFVSSCYGWEAFKVRTSSNFDSIKLQFSDLLLPKSYKKCKNDIIRHDLVRITILLEYLELF